MDVVGNNISNVNTVGYKGSRVVFEDLMSQTISGAKSPTTSRGGINATQIGLGTNLGSIDTIFTSGSPLSTGNVLDLAISGNGFFVVRGATPEDLYYTKAGDFRFDENGYLTNSTGNFVQGYLADENGTIPPDQIYTDVRLTEGTYAIAAKQTTAVAMAGVLDNRAEPTILEYQEFLTYATATDNILSTRASNGNNIDLVEGETVRVSSDATGLTSVKDIYDDNFNSASFEGLKLIINYIDSSGNKQSVTIDQTDANGDGTQDDPINTIDELQTAIANAISEIGSPTMNEGKMEFSATGNITIESVQVNNVALKDIFNGLKGTYVSGDTLDTKRIVFMKEIVTGKDFSDLTSLASEITKAINGNVVNNGDFTATFHETDDTATTSINEAGKFTYTSNSAITNFRIDKAYPGTVFENNMVNSSSAINIPIYDNTDETTIITSANFLTNVKDGNVRMIDLFNSNGQNLNLIDAAEITLSATINGTDLSDTTYTIDNTNDVLSDYMAFVSQSLKIPEENVKIVDGKLTIQSNNGIPNQIDFMSMKLNSGNNDNDKIFNNYMNYIRLQEATGGKFSTTQTVYDSQGGEHVIRYDYTLYDESARQWKLTITPLDSGDTLYFDSPFGGSEAILEFNPDGTFKEAKTIPQPPNYDSIVAPLTFTLSPSNGTSTLQGVTMDLGNSADSLGGMKLASANSSITYNEQDGYASGDLDTIMVNDEGIIIGTYTNGEVREIAQVALATFNNEQGLMKVGGSLFAETPNSGDGVIDRPGTGGRGNIMSGKLENSNVDLAQEFVTMITVQRGYQANSRVITTSDEMLQELMNLKR
jgi:flagellar hook protein FlgE